MKTMGTTYTAGLGVGFVFKVGDLLAPFMSSTPEESNMEERFDPKSGVRVEPVKVVTKRKVTSYNLLGEAYDYDNEVVEALASHLDAHRAPIGGLNERDSRVMLCVNNPYEGEEYGSAYAFTVHEGGFPASKDWTEPLKTLEGKLRELGIKPGEARIQTFCYYG